MSEYADQGTAAHKVLESCLESIYGWGLEISAKDFIGREIEIEDGEHSRLSPSGLKRTMRCPPSVFMGEKYPEETGPSPRKIPFDDDYAAAVQMLLDYIAERVAGLAKLTGEPVEVFTERKVTLAEVPRLKGRHEFDGTVDVILKAGAHADLIDLKAGAGVPVDVRDPQLSAYMAGVYSEFGPLTSVRLTIAQPRCDKVEPRIRHRDLAGKDLKTELDLLALDCESLLLAIAELDNNGLDDDDFNPSEEACRFCNVGGSAKYSGAPVCKAYTEFALQSAGVALDGLPDTSAEIFSAGADFAARDVHILTPEQLVGILQIREVVTGALQAAEAWALSMMREGTAPAELVAAQKLVRGRSNRKYLSEDEEENFKALRRIKVEVDGKKRGLGKKDLYEARLKSVASVEKLLKAFGLSTKDSGWKAFQRLVTKPEGALTIAPRSDPRPEVPPLRPTAEAVDEALHGSEGLEAPPVE